MSAINLKREGMHESIYEGSGVDTSKRRVPDREDSTDLGESG